MTTSSRVILPLAISISFALNTAYAVSKQGHDDDDSVYSWGRWETLSPAAGGNIEPPAVESETGASLTTDDYQRSVSQVSSSSQSSDTGPVTTPVTDDTPTEPQEPQIVEPPVEPPPVSLFGNCVAGEACGFATRNLVEVEGDQPTTGEGSALNTISLSTPDNSDSDAYQFVLNEGEADQVDSAVMDDYTGNRSRLATDADETSGLALNRYNDPAKGFWNNSSEEFGDETGYLAWGTAVPQGLLDQLNLNGVTASFRGTMESGLTNVDMTVNFGPAANWSADWTGSYNFSASGDVTGPNLVATDIQNATGEVGGFLAGTGTVDMTAIVGVDVVTDEGQYTDVGVLDRLDVEALKGPRPVRRALQ